MDLKEYLEALTEDEYLATAAAVLGKVDMPYNKMQLTGRILTFFHQEGKRKAILESVDEADSRILSLIYLYPGRRSDELIAFTGEGSIAGKLRLTSLEKRLLILSSGGCCYLNDLLDYSSVISQEVLEPKPEVRNIRFGEMLTALASLFNAHQLASTAARAARSFEPSRFPMLSEAEAKAFFIAFYNAGMRLGFLRITDNHTEFVARVFRRFMHLSELEKSAILLGSDDLKESVELLSLIMHCGDDEKIRALFPKYTRREDYAHLLAYPDEEKADGAIITQDFTIMAPALSLTHCYRFAECTKVDVMVSYTITKESILGAFDSGLSADRIIQDLELLSPVPEVIRNRIHAWQESYSQIRVYDYLYVECDERNARIIDQLPLLKVHIVKKVSPTGYLFMRHTEDQWRRIMVYAGLEMVGRTNTEEQQDNSDINTIESINCPSPSFVSLPEKFEESPRRSANLLRLVVSEKIRDPEEKEGFLAAIEKGYVTDESQIIPGRKFPKDRTASGFNFKAKLSLLAAAVKEKAVCELTTGDGKLICFITALENIGEKSTVTIAREDGRSETLTVASIFLVRIIQA